MINQPRSGCDSPIPRRVNVNWAATPLGLNNVSFRAPRVHRSQFGTRAEPANGSALFLAPAAHKKTWLTQTALNVAHRP